MLDIKLIRQNPDLISEALAKKNYIIDFTDLLNDDKKRRELITESETLKSRRNKVSSEIPLLKKAGKDCSDLISEMKELGEKVASIDNEIIELNLKISKIMDALPNMPADDLRAGGKENNEVVHISGVKPEFNFKTKNHVELAESLGLIDYPRGAKLAGSGFWVYTNLGARLEWALLNYFIEEHLRDNYEMMLLPHILNYECGYTAGQFPKFIEEVFWLEKDKDNNDLGAESYKHRQFILPTAETALVNIHRDEILEEHDLPHKLFAYTPCYRKEAGSYRSDERGMIRGHQFNKIEMFQYTTQEDGLQAFEELCRKASALVEKLGLHFQLSKLAAGDCSYAMAKTYDVEIWLPSMGIYKEISSISWAGDYQARRGNIKYRDKDGKLCYAHTLNASGLATSRVFPALLEQLQQADGSVIIPEVLRKYMGGMEKIIPVNKKA